VPSPTGHRRRAQRGGPPARTRRRASSSPTPDAAPVCVVLHGRSITNHMERGSGNRGACLPRARRLRQSGAAGHTRAVCSAAHGSASVALDTAVQRGRRETA
jgi:hypothetical protein